jgi:Flp pilus assembly protein TadD
VNAYNNRGAAQILLQRYEEALDSYDKVLAFMPDYAEAHHNRASALVALKRFDEAVAAYDKFVLLNPDSAEAYHNRGIALHALMRFDEALAAYDKALSLKPDFVEALNNRGNILKELQRYKEALSAYAKAIALNPNIAEIYNNRANIFVDLRRYDEAQVNYNKAIALKPDFAEANYHKGMLNLLIGNFEEGWPLHEWRWESGPLKGFARNFLQPLWLGEHSIAGKTILLHYEQGLGDTIQFARYVPMVEALGATVILGVPSNLVSLLRTLQAKFTLIAEGDALPEFDLHCPLMSLPLAFNTTVDSIPTSVPYLAADAQKQNEWRERIGRKVRPRIGLAWSGNPQHENDHNRSMALRTLEPLLHLDCEYHALQKEFRTEDRAALAEFTQIRTHEHELNDFADTAALVAELDVIITIDGAVAHLAGALGKAVWILLPRNSDFRWLTARSDSPWYPTAQLFRQRNLGDWKDVIAEVSSELRCYQD